MSKPLCIEIEEATAELKESVERISKEHGLPCFLLVPIVSEILSKLENGKRAEIEKAKKEIEKCTLMQKK